MTESSFSCRYNHIGTKEININIKPGEIPELPRYAAALYSDGGEMTHTVKWQKDFPAGLTEGEYIIEGTLCPERYDNPFIEERADPYVLKHEGKYYFTASYPAFGSVEKGYDRIILRQSDTLSGLSDAPEKEIWHCHNEGVMSRHIWAPEIHNILGKWYIFFAAGERQAIWNIRPFVLMCDGDPMNDPWTELGKMQACEGDNTSFGSFSLDMTYFEHKGRHYLIWAEVIGDSSLFMAEIDPREPWKLISKPILLTKPEFPWEKVNHRVNEGASVLRHKGRVFVFFSASGTGSEYCMGVVYADEDSDLMNEKSWTKVGFPVLKTEDLEGESGPGHNSFTTDDEGNTVIVYHARPSSHLKGECGSFCSESLYDPCRHARIKRVYFSEDGAPIINMKDYEILDESNKKVICRITVG